MRTPRATTTVSSISVELNWLIRRPDLNRGLLPGLHGDLPRRRVVSSFKNRVLTPERGDFAEYLRQLDIDPADAIRWRFLQ